MFRLFPPISGYVPPLRVRIASFVVYAALWPFIALLGLSYGIGVICRHHSGEEPLPKHLSQSRHRWHFSAAYNDVQGRN